MSKENGSLWTRRQIIGIGGLSAAAIPLSTLGQTPQPDNQCTNVDVLGSTETSELNPQERQYAEMITPEKVLSTLHGRVNEFTTGIDESIDLGSTIPPKTTGKGPILGYSIYAYESAREAGCDSEVKEDQREKALVERYFAFYRNSEYSEENPSFQPNGSAPHADFLLYRIIDPVSKNVFEESLYLPLFINEDGQVRIGMPPPQEDRDLKSIIETATADEIPDLTPEMVESVLQPKYRPQEWNEDLTATVSPNANTVVTIRPAMVAGIGSPLGGINITAVYSQ